MNIFSNADYISVIEGLVNDAFYIEELTIRGKISTIRTYAEIVVRRILNYPKSKHLTLGQNDVKKQLKDKNDPRLITAVELINNLGSRYIHTEYIDNSVDSKRELNNVLDSLFYLYSYMLIEFFERYQFGADLQIISAFSTLPPIIRYTTLNSLYDKYPNNICVIDKLTLVIIKAFDETKALEWVEERREVLEKISSVAESAIPGIIEKNGQAIAKEIVANAPNMYRLCIEKINAISKHIAKNGRTYEDFESAIDYYKNFGVVEGNSPEVTEFNSILEFLYLGRKPQYD